MNQEKRDFQSSHKKHDGSRFRKVRSAGVAANVEWAGLQELVTRIASQTETTGARFRWRSSGHHLILGAVAASFTFAQESEGTIHGTRIVFGTVPGLYGGQSSIGPKVWDVVPMSHDGRTIVWSVDGRGLFRSEQLAAEIVRKVVELHSTVGKEDAG